MTWRFKWCFKQHFSWAWIQKKFFLFQRSNQLDSRTSKTEKRIREQKLQNPNLHPVKDFADRFFPTKEKHSIKLCPNIGFYREVFLDSFPFSCLTQSFWQAPKQPDESQWSFGERKPMLRWSTVVPIFSSLQKSNQFTRTNSIYGTIMKHNWEE